MFRPQFVNSAGMFNLSLLSISPVIAVILSKVFATRFTKMIHKTN